MVYPLSERASGASNLTAKNRVWGFFANSNRTCPANRRKPSELRRKIRLTPTKTASGIPYWPSRDPIQERGGINLYGFVGNDGVSQWDLLGMIADATDIKDGDPCPTCCKTCNIKGMQPRIEDNGTIGHDVKAKVVSPTFESVCIDGKCDKKEDCCAARFYWWTCYYKSCTVNTGLEFELKVIPDPGAAAWTAVAVAVEKWKYCKCEAGKWKCITSEEKQKEYDDHRRVWGGQKVYLEKSNALVYSLDDKKNPSTANWVLSKPQ